MPLEEVAVEQVVVPVRGEGLAAWGELVVPVLKMQVPAWGQGQGQAPPVQGQAACSCKTGNGFKNKPSNKLNRKFATRSSF